MSTKKRDSDAAHASHSVLKHAPAEKAAPVIPKISDDERARMIQIRAYDLWERAGHPQDEAARYRFWCEAEKEITVVRAPG
jgi:hypothetical protein